MTDKEALDWLISRKEHYEMDDDCQELAEAISIGIDAIKQKMKKDRETKIGHWEYDREHCDSLNVAYTCSCCGRRVFVPYPFAIFYETKRDVYKSYPYCHCGARMVEPIRK